MIWKVPKLWEGKTVYIVGGGSSLKDLDLSLIENQYCIGINNAYMLGDWIDICWFGDSRWLDWHINIDKLKKGWESFKGIKASCCVKVKDDREIKYVKLSSKQSGIDIDPCKVSWNRTSGTSGINLAYHLGAKRIVLLGFDMGLINGRKNWHEDHFPHKDVPDPFPKFLKCWEFIFEDLKRLGVEIINTSMNSVIPEEYILKKELREVVNGEEECKEKR